MDEIEYRIQPSPLYAAKWWATYLEHREKYENGDAAVEILRGNASQMGVKNRRDEDESARRCAILLRDALLASESEVLKVRRSAEADQASLRELADKSCAAVVHVLKRIRDVPELYWHMGAMTEAEHLLIAAYSSQHGLTEAEVKKLFAPEPVAYNRWCDAREAAGNDDALRAELATAAKTIDIMRERAEAAEAREKALRDAVLSVLCDPEGRPSFAGSEGDREVFAKALAIAGAPNFAAIATKAPAPAGITDSQRLDFVKSRHADVCFVSQDESAEIECPAGWSCCFYTVVEDEPDMVKTEGHPTLEDAIDAAIRAGSETTPKPNSDAGEVRKSEGSEGKAAK